MLNVLQILKLATVLLFVPHGFLRGAELTLTSPKDYQVIQRTTCEDGMVHIAGHFSEMPPTGVVIEARMLTATPDAAWQTLHANMVDQTFDANFAGPAGGWYRLEVRASLAEQAVAQAAVEHIGIGELFVIAGQSNSANHGEQKLTPKSGRVAAFDGMSWRLAYDPQPGASGGGGSFIPVFGDALVEKFNVPIGVIACGIGATSVREWLPKDSTFPNPPTIESRVIKLPSGEWASNGDAFAMFVSRMMSLGPNGFRAVLWHQGESDANQQDKSRTLPGELYRDYLEKLIHASRREIKWDAPWFVAQVSYHVPGDEASADIRAAQASLWREGVALEGPDSDALKGKLRERDGQGVHFSASGLHMHGEKWAEKIGPWLELQLKI